MIELNKYVYEWMKKELQSQLYYLNEGWVGDCDSAECDTEESYKEYMEQMHKLYKETEIIIKYLKSKISEYEQEEADAIANANCFF